MSGSLNLRCQLTATSSAHRTCVKLVSPLRPAVPTSACLTSSSGQYASVLRGAGGRVLSVKCHAKHDKEERKMEKRMDGDAKGLKKEHKKLADTLKVHRKRLERLSDVYATATDMAAPTALLQDVLAELQQLKQLLTSRMVEDESSSSSSESEEEEMYDTRMDWKQRQAQVATATSSPSSDTTAPAASAIAGATPGLLVHTLHGDMEMPSLSRPPSPLAGGDAPVARVVVCQGSKCADRGAAALLASASQVAASYDGMVELATCKCLGRCKEGPAMKLQAAVGGASGVPPALAKALPRSVHTRVDPADVRALVASHLKMQQQAMTGVPPARGAEGHLRAPVDTMAAGLPVAAMAAGPLQQGGAEGRSPVAELLHRAALQQQAARN